VQTVRYDAIQSEGQMLPAHAPLAPEFPYFHQLRRLLSSAQVVPQLSSGSSSAQRRESGVNRGWLQADIQRGVLDGHQGTLRRVSAVDHLEDSAAGDKRLRDTT
jgi:hypothetical protein